MKKLNLIIAFVLSLNFVQAQNLVSNPGFEDSLGCPMTLGSIDLCKDWYAPTFHHNEYYTPCVPGWPQSPPIMQGQMWQYAHSGHDIIALEMYNSFIYPGGVFDRGYVQTKLLKKLTIGHHYRFSIYTSSVVDDKNGSFFVLSCNNTGVLFTTYAIKDTVAPHSLVQTPRLQPQVLFTQVVDDTSNWTLLTQDFVADSSYEYLTLGNFFNNAETQTIKQAYATPGSSLSAYYAFDDVSLIDLDAVGVDQLKVESEKLRVMPNPVVNQLSVIGYQLLGNTIQVFDVLGRSLSLTLSK
jgi:OmpA-OmpF porin, OOP family